MNLAHAVVLTEARSYVATLASTCGSTEAALEYESALIDLDTMHGGDSPPVAPVSLPTHELYDAACAAVEELPAHGVDHLAVELVLAALAEAHSLERRGLS